MQTERAGFGIIAEAGGVVRAHLEEDPHFEFAQRFPAKETVDVIESIKHRNHVDAVARAVGDQFLKLRRRVGAAFIRRKTELVLLPKFLEILESMNKQEDGRGSGLFILDPLFQLVG